MQKKALNKIQCSFITKIGIIENFSKKIHSYYNKTKAAYFYGEILRSCSLIRSEISLPTIISMQCRTRSRSSVRKGKWEGEKKETATVTHCINQVFTNARTLWNKGVFVGLVGLKVAEPHPAGLVSVGQWMTMTGCLGRQGGQRADSSLAQVCATNPLTSNLRAYAQGPRHLPAAPAPEHHA